MGEKLVVGPINKGLKNDRTAFVIDNDSFPTLVNAYQWRGRVKRKRGTKQLGRLKRYFLSTSTTYNPGATSSTTQTLDGSGVGNLLTGFTSSGIQTNATIVPGTVTITAPGPTLYTDPSEDGTLSPSGSINYATGEITIAAEAGNSVSAAFYYYPDLPVMGLEDLALSTQAFSGTLAFDTTYAYDILTTTPYDIYSVSFYKNPAADASIMPNYVAKTVWTPTTWNGQDYQQFFSTNYQGAFWCTNGINIPFVTTNIGMQFKAINTVTITAAGPPARASLNITAHGLIVGDFVFINEVATTTGINMQTGYVITVSDPNNVIVEFPLATIANAGTGGIAQYLTSRSDTTKDCIRWYDGDPTGGSPPTPTTALGWVNFMPPLSNGSFSIADLPAAQYYLAGARLIVPFKDRLLFIGPVVQTSTGSPIYLQDTIIYSQNGTPYYTSSFAYSTVTFTPSSSTTYRPLLLPANQTSQPMAFWENQTGFGGYQEVGISQPITTVSSNEDVLILGSTTRQMRLVYSGNDIVPFNIYTINSELGSGSTFSSINMDRGVITTGSRGFILTSQVGTQRIDLEIPDEIFQFKLTGNGTERVTAQRDYINEWIYFTYPSNNSNYSFPTQTLMYNYRDESWALFKETYTSYGVFRKQTGDTWSTLTNFTWEEWNDAWNSGENTLLQPEVIGGNAQGFVMIKSEGTGEDPSGYISDIDASSVVTSVNHCLNNGDYIVISGALGTISSEVNGKIFSVANATSNAFTLNPTVTSGTYLGSGVFTRMYVPRIQTKQFPVAWGMARKTRIGPQQYLFSRTDNGQITLQIFLSQDADDPYNSDVVVPNSSINNSLVYTNVLYTCPESTNLGLTAPNVNLQMVTGPQQAQIWHRMNTSLLGDTVQIGFTLSDTQMRDTTFSNQFVEIELHGFILDVSPSQLLS